MASVNEAMDLRASPASVWAVIGSPDALSDWHPAVTASPVSDGVRRLTLVDGAGLVEAIVEHSDDERFYVYEITESPLPVTGYRSRIAVEEADGGARVVWQAEFEPDDPAAGEAIADNFAGLFRAGLEALRERCEIPAGAV